MSWYVIKTHTKVERKAAAELRAAGLRVYVPKRTYAGRNRQRGSQQFVRRGMLLSGYVLVRHPEQPDNTLATRAAVERARMHWEAQVGQAELRMVLGGVDRSGYRAPFPIPDSMVAALMRRQRAHEFDDVRYAQMLRASERDRFWEGMAPGQSVRVVDGPFTGYDAEVESVLGKEMVTALITIFGREVRFQFTEPTKDLRPLADSVRAA